MTTVETTTTITTALQDAVNATDLARAAETAAHNAWLQAVWATDRALIAETSVRATRRARSAESAAHNAWLQAVTATNLARDAETAAFESWQDA